MQPFRLNLSLCVLHGDEYGLRSLKLLRIFQPESECVERVRMCRAQLDCANGSWGRLRGADETTDMKNRAEDERDDDEWNNDPTPASPISRHEQHRPTS